MSNQDKTLLYECINSAEGTLFSDSECEFPLDKTIIDNLKQIHDKLRENSDDYEIFYFKDEIDDLWVELLEKSIKCLRYYDKREPFQNQDSNKSPKAYGINDLKAYYDRYSKFEKVLYGTSKFYRDHVIHVFRTWLTGIKLLTKNEGVYLKKMKIQEKEINVEINNFEKISIWTIIALTHDLGYPLEKAKGIIDVTQEMVSTFVSNPDITKDFSFHGVQNYMNDYVVRLMSSRMKQKGFEKDSKNNEEKPVFVARLQSKYYFKFQKSLEKNSHGILSTLIIYKLLTYFLESDYNINEDYTFDNEDCRQFYIRREILRSIASHTCDDVYQLYMCSFAFLLRICDDTQEWGRKNISELYVKSGQSYKLTDIAFNFMESKANSCSIRESITLSYDEQDDSLMQLIDRFRKQSLVYVTIFRDGQDTANRDFSFKRNLDINNNDDIIISLLLDVDKDKASEFNVNVKYNKSTSKINAKYNKSFFEKINCVDKNSFNLYDQNKNQVDESDCKPENWSERKFSIDLIS